MKNFILSVAAMAVMVCGMVSCGSTPSAKMSNGVDSVAYAFGILQGSQFAAVQDSNTLIPDEQIKLDEFLAGFLQAIKRDSSAMKMTAEEADSYLREYFQQVREKQEAKRQAEVNAEKTKGAEYMAENAKKEGVVTTESGLQIETLVAGTGAQAQDGDKVLVNYKGSLIDGTQFDANDSTEFNVNGVVKGFKEGILAMKEGGKVIVTMPSDLGYGDRGAGQNIPGGATLVFEIELLKVTPAAKK